MSGVGSKEDVVRGQDSLPPPDKAEEPPGKAAPSTSGSVPEFVLLMRNLESAWPLSLAVLLLVIIILGALRAE